MKSSVKRIDQHIYIVSDEEIKVGCWFIRVDEIHKAFKVHKDDIEFLTSKQSIYCGQNTFWDKNLCQKIIKTTDPELIKDGIQEIISQAPDLLAELVGISDRLEIISQAPDQ